MLFALELKFCRTQWSVDMVHLEMCAFLLGKEHAMLVLRHTFLRKAVVAECRRAGLGV